MDVGDQESGGLGLLVPLLGSIIGITMILEILMLLHNYTCGWEEVRDIFFILLVMLHPKLGQNDHLKDDIGQDGQGSYQNHLEFVVLSS